MSNGINAEVLSAEWPAVTIKLMIDGEMHCLRWRRRVLKDEVLFDGEVVGTADSLFQRETVFGVELPSAEEDAPGRRLLLTVDAQAIYDWNWNCMVGSEGAKVAGVRLDAGEAPVLVHGSFARDDQQDDTWSTVRAHFERISQAVEERIRPKTVHSARTR